MNARSSVGAGKFLKDTLSKSVVTCAAMFFLFGCTPDPIPLDNTAEQKPEIVVSSEILPDNSVAVLLTKTVSGSQFDADKDGQVPLDKIALDDADVTIRTNGVTYKLQHWPKGMYKAKIPFVNGSRCDLYVNSKSLGEVTATTYVQTAIKFDTVDAKVYDNDFGNYWAEVQYALKDPPARNYYMVNVQGTSSIKELQTLLNNNNYTRLLEDTNFNGQKFSEVFRAINRNFYGGDSISVSLTNVSEDYFKYIKMRVQNNMNLVEIFSEPVHYPTNVKGGRGFFNLHYPDARLIVLN